jgi:hypothetical protein
MLVRIWQRASKHQSILKRVRQGELNIGHAHCERIARRIVGYGRGSQRCCKFGISPADNLGKDMIAAGEVPIGRLMRHTQAPRHVAQAELFKALLFDNRHGFGKACLS